MYVINYLLRWFGTISLWKLFMLLLPLVVISLYVLEKLLETTLREHEVPVIVWWTKFMPQGSRITLCNHKYNCFVTSTRLQSYRTQSYAYLFYGSHLDNYDFPLPRNNSILWGIFHEESPKNYAPFIYKEIQNIFNVSATFSRYSNYPITLQYLPHINNITDQKYFVHVEKKNTFLRDIAPVLYIQSDCDTPSNRDYMVLELMKYISIDSYGQCLQNKRPLNFTVNNFDLYDEDYLNFISKYKFIISFENAVCDDYITEKLWRPLIVGSIPVYLGSLTVEDWLPNNFSAILVKNHPNMMSLAKFIHKVNTDDDLYNSFLKHKISQHIGNNFLKKNADLREGREPVLDFECFVCKALHEKTYFNTVENRNSIYNCPKPINNAKNNFTWDQHWDIGKCQAKAINTLMNENKPYTAEEFEKLWNELLGEKQC